MHGYRGLHKNVLKHSGYFVTAPPRLASGLAVGVSRAVRRFRGRKFSLSDELLAKETGIAATSEAGLYAEARYSIIRLVELLVEDAYVSRASDIHLEPRAHALFVRLRVDGCLLDAHELPLAVHSELVSRIKILADLRIDEHHAAQDGRFKLVVQSGASVDVRVSIAPTYYGENAVLRLLTGSGEAFSLESLSFTDENRSKILRAMKRPYGMMLATGPTGSGKTTTLYTLVQMLNAPGVSTVTLEDPVEYSMPGVSQIQINPKTGLTFGAGLRSILRQDPDVIMVGEIRDAESASLAVNAALTGHRLLSTLHTNDAVGAVTRLLDMGVEPYLIASTVSLSIGQRLVRRVCSACTVAHRLTEAEMQSVQPLLADGASGPRHFSKGRGCSECRGTGYRGRAGVHEILEITPAIREAILARRSAAELQAIAHGEGMVPITFDAMHKASEGITTIEEALKTGYE